MEPHLIFVIKTTVLFTVKSGSDKAREFQLPKRAQTVFRRSQKGRHGEAEMRRGKGFFNGRKKFEDNGVSVIANHDI